MTFRVVLTIMIAIGIGSSMESVDKPRKPVTVGQAVAQVIVSSIVLYGIWNWL